MVRSRTAHPFFDFLHLPTYATCVGPRGKSGWGTRSVRTREKKSWKSCNSDYFALKSGKVFFLIATIEYRLHSRSFADLGQNLNMQAGLSVQEVVDMPMHQSHNALLLCDMQCMRCMAVRRTARPACCISGPYEASMCWRKSDIKLKSHWCDGPMVLRKLFPHLCK